MSDLDLATELAISGILSELVDRMKERISETVAQSAFYGIIQAQRELKLPINPIAAKQPALTYAQRYQEELNRGGTTINGEFIDWFNKYGPKENADSIADIITKGMREGKPLGRWEYRGLDGIYPSDTVADDIMKHMGQQYKSGASRIARTEVVRTLNENSLDRYKASSVTHVMVRDGCGCAVCAEINGSIWTIEESYQRTTEHPNCRRSFTPIVPGFPLPEQMAASPMPEDDPGSNYYIPKDKKTPKPKKESKPEPKKEVKPKTTQKPEPKSVQNRIVDFAGKHQHSKDEHVEIYRADGTVLLKQKGSEDKVSIKPDAKYKDAISIHNHPQRGCPGLSPDDVHAAIVMDLKETITVDAKGVMYRLQRPETGWPDLSKDDIQAAWDSVVTKLKTDGNYRNECREYFKTFKDKNDWDSAIGVYHTDEMLKALGLKGRF